MPKPMTRAAIYTRVSTTHQDVAMQLVELRQAGAQRGWKVREYTDQVTGVREHRPGLDALRADVKAGCIDLVAVWKLDRLGRSVPELLHLVTEITDAGAGFLSLHDPGIDTTTPTGRMLLTILAAFSAFERDVIRERSMAGQAHARAMGKHCGRPLVQDLSAEAAREAIARHGGQRPAAKALGVPLSRLQRRAAGGGGPNG